MKFPYALVNFFTHTNGIQQMSVKHFLLLLIVKLNLFIIIWKKITTKPCIFKFRVFVGSVKVQIF